MAEPMIIRARMQGDIADVRVLVKHEMETGLRKDAPKPAHYIKTITATHMGKIVLSAQWGPALAKNPTLFFKFRGATKGDKVTINWIDNLGDKRSDEATID